MSSKFFNNQDGNTLENRLKDILSYYNVEFLEFLIGYFRISGFVKIAPYLSRVKKARILVGINVDKVIADAHMRGKKPNLYDYVGLAKTFVEEQKEVLSTAAYTKDVDDSIDILLDMLANNRLELKISKDKNIHSKIYILREEPKPNHDGSLDYRGSVITGSSNLSENGLATNYEFNVELRDSADIRFSLEEFEKLWVSAVEITNTDIDTIKKESYLREITPYELYIKFLVEHFGDRISYDASVAEDLPKGFKKLAYQIDAVNEGLSKIKKHGGFFLSDVVGLGKTITAAMIVKRLLFETKGKVLIIAPPSIEKEWGETFDKFKIGHIRHYRFASYAELEKIKDASGYEVVIIDESHKFKNYATSRYKELERITKESTKYRKKIILISATPLNNKPQDIANQLYLFQNKRKSTIDSFPNLESFFAKIDKEYKEIIKNNKDETNKTLTPKQMVQLKELSKRVRDNILREVMVRRTRTDIQTIERYRDDIEVQGLTIPRINEVKELEYYLNPVQFAAFDKSIDTITKKLNYSRYKALAYMTQSAQDSFGDFAEGFLSQSASALASIMQILLVKRLESSFWAFKSSIRRQLNNLTRFIDMFDDDRVLIPTKKFDLYELLEDNEDSFEDLVDSLVESDKAKLFSKSDFRDGYYELLQEDLRNLSELVACWDSIEEDPKLDRFKEILATHKKDKVVVFTESKETAMYLQNNISGNKILVVHGGNRDKLKNTIRENFDANHDTKKDDYNIIISTDTLSEGVNMHRSNIIYNYDIPWNSTRLMQRIGRINRIGTTHSEIHIFNFKPTTQSESLIELSKKAYIKLQTFHHSLGEDSKIYTKEEEVESVTLFEDGAETQLDEELLYLEQIRNFREANPNTFNQIAKMPKKMRVQRASKDQIQKSYVFIKNSDSKNYYTVSDGICTPANFVEMAKALEADRGEKAVLPIHPRHYDDVAMANKAFEAELNGIIASGQNIRVDNALDKKTLTLIKSWRDKEFVSTSLYETLEELIKEGRYLNLSKNIGKIQKTAKPYEIMPKVEELLNRYGLGENEENSDKIDGKIDIILSESFV